jgi:hypothetical protein
MSAADTLTCNGGCHCGAVRFQVDLPRQVEVQSCNCSVCAMAGFLHVIVPQSRFRLMTDEAALTAYTFNTGVARHLFCSTCGVKSFYRPRSNPDGWSVNARCLDTTDGLELNIEAFDGQNWEAHAHALSHLSQDQ